MPRKGTACRGATASRGRVGAGRQVGAQAANQLIDVLSNLGTDGVLGRATNRPKTHEWNAGGAEQAVPLVVIPLPDPRVPPARLDARPAGGDTARAAGRGPGVSWSGPGPAGSPARGCRA